MRTANPKAQYLRYNKQIKKSILRVLDSGSYILGKEVGSDKAKLKATWPALFGIEESIKNCKLLCDSAIKNLSIFGNEADGLRMLGNIIIGRNSWKIEKISYILIWWKNSLKKAPVIILKNYKTQ